MCADWIDVYKVLQCGLSVVTSDSVLVCRVGGFEVPWTAGGSSSKQRCRGSKQKCNIMRGVGVLQDIGGFEVPLNASNLFLWLLGEFPPNDLNSNEPVVY